MKEHKVHCEQDKNGFVLIRCPRCQRQQQVIISDEWYLIDLQGHVDPIFVCMEPTRKCDFMGHIWIVNFN